MQITKYHNTASQELTRLINVRAEVKQREDPEKANTLDSQIEKQKLILNRLQVGQGEIHGAINTII